MGYSTTLYKIDLATLTAAVGSNDQNLLARVQAVQAQQTPTIDPTQGPRLKVTRDGQILFNGKSVTSDEMRDLLRDPKWAGMNLYWYQENGPQSGPWKVLGSFMRHMQPMLSGTRISALICCDSDEELLNGWEDEELSQEKAAADLIAGHFTQPESSYGYGLELLCQVLGVKLGVIPGKGRLKALKLNMPLAEARLPVPLPHSDDFPYVSHLTAAEVAQEVRRLEGVDLAYPKSTAIEEDRRTLFQYLHAAKNEGLAVVSFYY